MKKEIIVSYPNKKEGTTGLAIQVLTIGDYFQGIYIGRFWDNKLMEKVFVDKDEIEGLIDELRDLTQKITDDQMGDFDENSN